MLIISVTTDDNFKKVLAMTKGLSGNIRDAARKALVRSVQHVWSEILGSGRVPYQKGDLRRSILPWYERLHTQEGEMEGGVGTDKIYAPIHELGLAVKRTTAWGRKTKPYIAQYKERAYMRVPFQEAQPTIELIFNEELEKATRIK